VLGLVRHSTRRGEDGQFGELVEKISERTRKRMVMGRNWDVFLRPGDGDTSADLDRRSGGWSCQTEPISIKKTSLVTAKQSTANDDDGYCTGCGCQGFSQKDSLSLAFNAPSD
jgi:hypothetical protein